VLLVGVAGTSHTNGVTPSIANYSSFHFVAAPLVNGNPANAMIATGGSATFTVSASGSAEGGALRYQWRHNGVNVTGATGTTLTINDAQPSDAGNYDVVVSNSGGSTTSASASLTVVIPPSVNGGSASKSGNNFSAAFATQSGVTYIVEYKDSLNDPAWLTLQTIGGDGTVKAFTDPAATVAGRFYRIRVP